MDEIYKKYEKILNFSEVKRNLNIKKEELDKNALKIQNLKKEEKNISEKIEKIRINEIISELEKLRLEIKKMEIVEQEISDIKTFKNLTKIITDKKIICGKAEKLFYNYFCIYTGKIECIIGQNEFKKQIFHSLDISSDLFICIFSKELEIFFCFLKEFDNEIYKNIKKIFLSFLKRNFKNINCENIFLFESKNSICVVYNYIDTSYPEKCNLIFSKVDEFDLSKYKETNLNLMIDKYSNICKYLANILFENLKKYILKNKIEKNKLKNSFLVFLNTKYFTNDLDRFILDILMKHMIDLSKRNRENVELQEFKSQNHQIPKIISKNYLKLITNFKKLNEIDIQDNEKVFDTIMKIFVVFFSQKKTYKSLTDLFSLFCDLTHFIKLYESIFYDESKDKNSENKNFNNFLKSKKEEIKNSIQNLEKSKKKILKKIFEKGGQIDFIFLGENTKEFKSKIKMKYKLFIDILNLMLPESMKLSIEIGYSEYIYMQYIDYVLFLPEISYKECDTLSEVGQFIIDLESIPKNYISNYPKILAISEILQMNLNELEIYIKKNKNVFSYTEISGMVNSMFEESEKRERFLKNLKNYLYKK
ncbi:hypothetical protein LUQ84_001092 [Hamiltosporidium tvaerminnensis]|nr:hypothetical protein LUQ84_001092 [Hamiltosporidium tvaerminnensis]